MQNLPDYIENTSAIKQLKVSDLLFAEYTCLEKEKKISVWSHHNYFVYVLSGKKKWYTMEQEYMVEAGQSLFVKKGANLAYQYFDDEFCALMIFLPDSFIRDALRESRVATKGADENIVTDDSIVRLRVNEVLQAYFQSVLSYFSDAGNPTRELMELKFSELILNLSCDPDNSKVGDYFNFVSKSGSPSIRYIMEENFAYNMNLEDYARLCNRSLSSFKRDFKDIYAMPPGKWLTQKRLSYGKYLLEHTDKNVNQVAFESGFKNVSHFVRVFKIKYGDPPLQFSRS